ncbi:MAG: primosomal protein N' [Prolixibacteraceae bacterium]|nr:primosomal protein N' [Prolixibacteraceae bacterium]MBT6764198.1 primosomal protein N' [Prolixibacteraceae bacterium]MBT6999133.1 primosomal protein N' [Prolixibacteraceae bacterium]MBT7396087.1 primosomal protein N' [Prolixibacteraceae bacterium]
MSDLFAKVILPLSLHDAFTYKVPPLFEKQIQPGQRVVVQFGQKKYYAALVISLTKKKPGAFEAKEVLQVLDEQPVVLPGNFELWNWISKYYCCTLGDVFRAALPSGLKMESKSKIYLTSEEFEGSLSEKERFLVQQLKQNVVSVVELQKTLGGNFSYPALKSLLKKKVVFIEERISSKYKPKTKLFVKFHPEIKTEDILNSKTGNLKKAKKQLALLYHFCHKTKAFDSDQISYISKKELFEATNFNTALLNELVKKNILVEFQKQVSRIDEEVAGQVSINLLNKHQEKALAEIKSTFKTKQVSLIHGITASGKTEIYIHLIDEILKTGHQALYLLPEIALTTQIMQRLKNVFGKKVGIYHSKLNSQERVEIWEKVLRFNSHPDEGYQIILGARSAVFMPFSKLGLIIVDEEHENSFKQYDPAPRYNARDTAVVLGVQNNAKILLGSATPSFETYFNTSTGKYGLANLFKRHSNIELPEIIIADVKRAYKKKQMRSFLSPQLFELMETALEKNEQIILFQNRRGYSPFVECFSCGWVPKCNNCDVSLTYHKYKSRLSCHYCGFSKQLPGSCDECGSPEIKTRGFGTEKIEDELKSLFRNARIQRMDLDTTQSKNAFEKIIHNLENRKTDILIGTQMLTKGLDFEHVSLVGILNADNLINFPDFRAHERAYQLISQVSGRAGRKHNRGKVVIQTSQPEHQLIQLIRQQNYPSSFNHQLEERRLFRYPPFYRLIKLVVKHKKIETVNRVADQLCKQLKENKAIVVLGPEFPLISRIQLWHHKEIWLKIDRKTNPAPIKMFVNQTIQAIKKQADNSNSIINIDVDPA